MPDPLLLLFTALLGLTVGSFLNVVAYRLPRGWSIVHPSSRCPRCDTPIRLRDNVPVLSWLALRGRCRACGVPIPLRYPLLEAVTGGLYVLVLVRLGPTPELLAGWILAALLVVLTAIDVEHFLLPDVLTLGGTVVALTLRAYGAALRHQAGEPWATAWVPLREGLLGTALGAGVLLALVYGWYLVRREWGMGLGDVKMLAMLGAFLGRQGTIVALFVATLSGALVGLVLVAVAGAGMKTRLPFGAFLGLGGIVALLVGDLFVNAYLQLL